MESSKKDVILIVDDRPSNLKLLFHILKHSGFQVLMAKDGETAIQKVETVVPDLILLDVLMPGMDGFETCQRLKSSLNTKDIPIIFMTALTDSVNKVKGLSVGAVDYITKPFQQEELLARVQLHLRLRNLTITLEEQNKLLKEEVKARLSTEAKLQQLMQQLEQRVVEQNSQLTQALQDLQQTQIQLLQREQKIGYYAFHDLLTDLPNRALFMNRLQQAIGKAYERSDYLYAVLFIDLDRFKVINDSLGHLMGDELLKAVARQLQASLRHSDTVARFGGDEFVILLENLKDINEAICVADRIQKQLRIPFKLNDYELFTEVSIGIIFSNIGYEKPEDVLRDADIAMYHAKAKGKGRYEVFDRAMQTNAMGRLHLENDLRRAIFLRNADPNILRQADAKAVQEFCLYYQPIVSLSNLELIGFEALVRWHNPHKGWISPDKFIPVAEEIGLIDDLGWWILQEACTQISIWHQLFPHQTPLTINVNFSAMQLKQLELVSQIEEILEETGIPTSSLKIEITESCLLETLGLEQKFSQLRDLGIKLCIDDFGTGYSSLSRLHEFPIDTLKIDRSFVKLIGSNKGHTEIIQTIMTLARSRGMEVVAEGVETIEQLAKLQSLGCDFGQGYLFSKPLDSENAIQILSDGRIFRAMLLGEK